MKHCKTHNTHYFEFSACYSCDKNIPQVMYQSVYDDIESAMSQNYMHRGTSLYFKHGINTSSQKDGHLSRFKYLDTVVLVFGMHGNNDVQIELGVHQNIIKSKKAKEEFCRIVKKSVGVFNENGMPEFGREFQGDIKLFEHIMISSFRDKTNYFYPRFNIKVNRRPITDTNSMNKLLDICSGKITTSGSPLSGRLAYMESMVENPPFPGHRGMLKYARYEGLMAIMPEILQNKGLLYEYTAPYGIAIQ